MQELQLTMKAGVIFLRKDGLGVSKGLLMSLELGGSHSKQRMKFDVSGFEKS